MCSDWIPEWARWAQWDQYRAIVTEERLKRPFVSWGTYAISLPWSWEYWFKPKVKEIEAFKFSNWPTQNKHKNYYYYYHYYYYHYYECSTFLDMMNDIGIDKKQQFYIIKKMINTAIRVTYYIFCCRNRNLDSPDLMQFQFLLLLLFLFCFVFVFVFFFFLIIQSQAAFVNCLYVARFTIVHSKTQIKFIMVLLPLLLLLFP